MKTMMTSIHHRICRQLGRGQICQRRTSTAIGHRQCRFLTTPTTTIKTRTGLELFGVDQVIYDNNDNDNNDEQQSSHDQWLANAIRPYYDRQRPVVIRGACAEAPAVARWPSLDYWRAHLFDANDVANVEIGGSYGSSETQPAAISCQQYLDYLQLFHQQHGATGLAYDEWLVQDDENDDESSSSAAAVSQPQPEELVYMAQNDLLPGLYQDVKIPAFCQGHLDDDNNAQQSKHNKVGHGKLYSVMLWLGPRQSLSPLHYDPLDNCLMQYVGRKRVVLFPPNNIEDDVKSTTTEQSYNPHWHYAGADGQQSNTSPIDIETTPLDTLQERYPQFRGRPPAYYALLQPGDLLYIPSKWWHHVRSLDTAASVNVWFR